MPPSYSVVVFVRRNQINPTVLSQLTVPVYFTGGLHFVFHVMNRIKVSTDGM